MDDLWRGLGLIIAGLLLIFGVLAVASSVLPGSANSWAACVLGGVALLAGLDIFVGFKRCN